LRHKTEAEWLEVRADFERGEAFKALARHYGLSAQAIRDRAKRGGWRQRIHGARGAQETVAARKKPDRRANVVPAEVPKKEFGDVDGSDRIIDQGRSLIARMIEELDVVTSLSGELEELIGQETAEDRSSNRREGMLRAIGLGARSATMKNLATAAKTLSEINGLPQGKKAAQEQKAEASRFEPMATPKLVISNE
jgi:hypothetical protein